ncbi:MAG: polysaccharide biosynthesis C-terminal domain-containing protein [Lachnospira sp.]
MSLENRKNFILHGSILAIAGIIVRIIGMLYRIPVLNIIGSEGNGIYGVAFNVYNICLVLSSYGLPMAVSKLVSARFAKRKYKSADKVFKCSLVVATITGGIAALLVFFGAEFIENVIYAGALPGLAIPLRVLAPTIFMVAILGVIRGFFQGQSTMIPTAVSQIFEQIVNAVVSIVAGYILIHMYSESVNKSAYGAAGSTLGTAMGAFTALVFMIFIYMVYRPTFQRMKRKDRHTRIESDSRICGLIIVTMIPIILGQTFYQISSFLDDIMFSNIMVNSSAASQISTDLGNFSSSYVLLISIPQGIASAMSASMLPSIVAAYTNNEQTTIHSNITKTLKSNMFIAIPSFVGLFVIGSPIIKLLFSSYDSVQGGIMLKIGAIAIVFYTLSTVTSSALQGIDKMRLPMIHSFISLVVHLISVFILLKFTSLGIYALVIGNATFPILIFILNLRALRREIRYNAPYMDIFAKPGICALIMGVATFFAYKLMINSTGSNIISICVAFLVAGITYFGPYFMMTRKFRL